MAHFTTWNGSPRTKPHWGLWDNYRRLHGEIGHIPPVEVEAHLYSNLPAVREMERV